MKICKIKQFMVIYNFFKKIIKVDFMTAQYKNLNKNKTIYGRFMQKHVK
jgi:hypothetical protein